ncbi:MAG: SOS response-associated peptidase family protein [Eubacteriaceae bacterium]|nr:SOS response-associated peptidase family protein [Eubacteriaceae bacterium]
MCGRYLFPDESSRTYITRMLSSLRKKGQEPATGDLVPGSMAAVLALSKQMKPDAFCMRWGYSLSDGKLVFNSRSESASSKSMFSEGMRSHRCLIPASGYYEWEKTDNGKRKYLIRPKDEDIFFMAGIYRTEDDGAVFSILTRESSPDIAFIHDRMPVIFREKDAGAWLELSRDADRIIEGAFTEMEYTPQ